VDYPSTSNVRIFKRLWITHLLNVLIEIMNHPPLVKVLIYIFLWPCPFQENKYFHPWRKFLLPLNMCNRKISLFLNPLYNYKETKHRQCLKAFQRSYNQPIKKLSHQTFKISRFHQPSTSQHPTSMAPYLDNRTQVGFIGTLLSSITLVRFPPLLECQSSFLNHFETFLKEFSVFGDSNKEHIATSKLRILRQGSRPTFMYASIFKQLACNISWGKAMFTSQF
jgi:hypothetical protein